MEIERMEDKLRSKLKDEYEMMLADNFINKIEQEEIGMAEDDSNCNSILMSIILRCMENLAIFTSKQLNNITDCINRIRYAQ